MEIIRQAQVRFHILGIDQWQDGYPNDAVITADILNGHSYVLLREEGVVATAMISFDGEPTYASIEGGRWLSDLPYVVIHRIAVESSRLGEGIAGELLCYAQEMALERGITSMRIDTHPENLAMQHAAERFGFLYCGVIHLESGAVRLAYEKLLTVG